MQIVVLKFQHYSFNFQNEIVLLYYFGLIFNLHDLKQFNINLQGVPQKTEFSLFLFFETPCISYEVFKIVIL